MLVPPQVMSLTKICDTESSRYALGGVQFGRDEEGKPHATVTDGRRLMHATWNEPHGDEYPDKTGIDREQINGFTTIIAAKDCEEAAKLPPKKSLKPILANILIGEHPNGEVSYGATDLEKSRVIKTRALEGRFPAWREVVPKYRELTIREVDAIRDLYHDALRGEKTDEELLAAIKEARQTICESDEHQGVKGIAHRVDTVGCPLACMIQLNAVFLKEMCDVTAKVAPGACETYSTEFVVPLAGCTAAIIRRKDDVVTLEGVLMPLARD